MEKINCFNIIKNHFFLFTKVTIIINIAFTFTNIKDYLLKNFNLKTFIATNKEY